MLCSICYLLKRCGRVICIILRAAGGFAKCVHEMIVGDQLDCCLSKRTNKKPNYAFIQFVYCRKLFYVPSLISGVSLKEFPDLNFSLERIRHAQFNRYRRVNRIYCQSQQRLDDTFCRMHLNSRKRSVPMRRACRWTVRSSSPTLTPTLWMGSTNRDRLTRLRALWLQFRLWWRRHKQYSHPSSDPCARPQSDDDWMPRSDHDVTRYYPQRWRWNKEALLLQLLSGVGRVFLYKMNFIHKSIASE